MPQNEKKKAPYTVYLTEKEMCTLFGELSGQIQDWVYDHCCSTGSPKIFGIPRGGVPVAYRIAGMLGLEIVDSPEEADILVDDIQCSGKTSERYTAMATANSTREVKFFSLLQAPPSSSDPIWYVFPWEASSVSSAEDIPLRMLQYIGEDPTREGLRETPARVVRAWGEMFAGYRQDPIEILKKQFNAEGYNQMILLKDIEFYSTCEHHLLPFTGKIHIGYIPKESVVGISKLARLSDCFSRRAQIQERLTNQIADSIFQILEPLGVAVLVEAQHHCMMCRGVQKQNSRMITSALRGCLVGAAERMEFLLLKQ